MEMERKSSARAPEEQPSFRPKRRKFENGASSTPFASLPRLDRGVVTSICSPSPLLRAVSMPAIKDSYPIPASDTSFGSDSRNIFSTRLRDRAQESIQKDNLNKARHQPTAKLFTASYQEKEKNGPTEAELEEFFSAAENSIHDKFKKRYNFDFFLEKPLVGRYQWVRLKK